MSYRIWGDGVSLPQLGQLKWPVLKGPVPALPEARKAEQTSELGVAGAPRGPQLQQVQSCRRPSCQEARPAGSAPPGPPKSDGQHPHAQSPITPEALTVLHAGAGWGPQDPSGLDFGAL